MKQKLQKYLDDCIKLRIPPFFEIVLSSLRRFVSRTKRFRAQFENLGELVKNTIFVA